MVGVKRAPTRYLVTSAIVHKTAMHSRSAGHRRHSEFEERWLEKTTESLLSISTALMTLHFLLLQIYRIDVLSVVGGRALYVHGLIE